MHLDLFTVFVLLATMCFLLGAGMVLIWLQSPSERGLLFWGISFFLRVPAFPLLLLRGEIHDRLSVDLANGFLLAGTGLGWYATRLYTRRNAWLPVAVAPVVIWFAACLVPAIHQDMQYRLMVTTSLTTLYSVAIGLDFWRDAEPRHYLRKALAVVFMLNGTMHLARGVAGIFTDLPHRLTNGSPAFAWFLFGTIILVMIGAMIGMGLYREKYLNSLKHEAEHDALTSTLNRRAFLVHANKLIHAHNADSAGATVALLVFDLDHFKKVNDTFGHLAGDKVLKHFATTIKSHLRGTDLFGRIGGEEFAALLRITHPEDAGIVAEKLRKAVSTTSTTFGELEVPVTVSIGIAERIGKVPSFDALMTQADAALYMAKQRGRNRVHGAPYTSVAPEAEEAGAAELAEAVAYARG